MADAKRLRGLGDESRRLKHPAANLSPGKEALMRVIQKGGSSLPPLGKTWRTRWPAVG